MKKISILGSTGSIGISALDVIDHLGSAYSVIALSAKSNIDLLEKQIARYRPEMVAVFDEDKAIELKKRCPGVKISAGLEGLKEIASLHSADIVLSAMSGTIGLIPTLAAIEAGKNVALANKEVLVSGGELVLEAVKRKRTRLLPVDSEHSAIYQCLMGESKSTVSRLILTASGGPFRSKSLDELKCVTVEQALGHPTWSMGPKITVDCSTLMNKGLEMIEAHFLFDMPPEKIDIVIHPQSLIHSMVEFADGSIKAQMSKPDMKLPIQFAFTFPYRQKGQLAPFDFNLFNKLEFFQPDRLKFKCLELAYEAVSKKGTLLGYMNAANEELVGRFLKKEIGWLDIPQKLERLMQKHEVKTVQTVQDIIEMDNLARSQAKEI
jgi:1-deoxy-D-xylulose-5-phosphate reductoisomerase